MLRAQPLDVRRQHPVEISSAARPGARCRRPPALRVAARQTVPDTENPSTSGSSASAAAQRTPDWVARWQDNIALAGNFAPVQNEVTLRGLQVQGHLPSSVDGVWMRNGPNPRFEPEEGSLFHWFGACVNGAFAREMMVFCTSSSDSSRNSCPDSKRPLPLSCRCCCSCRPRRRAPSSVTRATMTSLLRAHHAQTATAWFIG